MSACVIDASAILAYLGGEPGGPVVEAAIPGGLLSAANAAEVMAKLIERGAPADSAAQAVLMLPCVIEAIDVEVGLEAGRLHAMTRARGLSLGDRLCLALARRRGLPALTADRAWSGAVADLEVSLIR